MFSNYVQWCRASGQRESTVCLRVMWLRRAAADLDLVSATRPELLAFLSRPDWRPETRRCVRSVFRSYYRWLVDAEIRADDPSLRLPVIRVPSTVPRPVPTDVLRQALADATDRDRIILGLAAYAGLRRTEIAELPWSSVQWPSLRVVGKGGRVRVVPMLPVLAEVLADARARRDAGKVGTGWRFRVDPASPFVLPSPRGGHLQPDTVGQVMTRKLGGGWTGHTLRHRFATMAYAVDHDLLTVQQLLGHSKPETTARYTATPTGAAARAVAGVAA